MVFQDGLQRSPLLSRYLIRTLTCQEWEGLGWSNCVNDVNICKHKNRPFNSWNMDPLWPLGDLDCLDLFPGYQCLCLERPWTSEVFEKKVGHREPPENGREMV